MKKYIFCLLALILSIPVTAGDRRMRGVVTAGDEPVAGAIVMEINKDKRILHQTYTDQQGNYSIPVTKITNSIRVLVPGYYALTQKIHEYDYLNFHMVAKPAAVDVDTLPGKRRAVETNRLLAGHVGDQSLPQLCRLEQISDTLFTLIIPLRVNTMTEEYPVGRRIIFLDMLDNQLLSTTNMMDVSPIVGETEDIGRTIHIVNDYHMTIKGAQSEAEETKYVYPRYRLNLQQLVKLNEISGDIKRIAMDTPRADNYGILYPSANFASEMRRIVSKLLDSPENETKQ